MAFRRTAASRPWSIYVPSRQSVRGLHFNQIGFEKLQHTEHFDYLFLREKSLAAACRTEALENACLLHAQRFAFQVRSFSIEVD